MCENSISILVHLDINERECFLETMTQFDKIPLVVVAPGVKDLGVHTSYLCQAILTM
jgi:hypothetical protein